MSQHPDLNRLRAYAELADGGPCWICGDKPLGDQEGYSSSPIVLPGFRKPVWICGMCLIRSGSAQHPDLNRLR